MLVAVVILLCPPLLRANARFRRPTDAPSTFRLNRGFDVPETKSTLDPPVDRVSADTVDVREGLAPLALAAIDEIPLGVDNQHRQSPDPLRGPPTR